MEDYGDDGANEYGAGEYDTFLVRKCNARVC